MVPVPAPLLVQGYHQQLTVCYPFQEILARPLLRYGLAQRCGKFIRDSYPQHELRHVVRKNIDHFSQVGPDGPQRPGKLPDVLPEILSRLRECGSGDPYAGGPRFNSIAQEAQLRRLQWPEALMVKKPPRVSSRSKRNSRGSISSNWFCARSPASGRGGSVLVTSTRWNCDGACLSKNATASWIAGSLTQ
jgi:hypothetical protein